MNPSRPRRASSSSESGTVIPFPAPFSGPEVPTYSHNLFATQRLPKLDELKDELKAAIESYITEAYFRDLLTLSRMPDNPFDAIYISRLTPDSILSHDISQLRRYRSIHDLSDSLDFSDDWQT
jgi:hypothetical protein